MQNRIVFGTLISLAMVLAVTASVQADSIGLNFDGGWHSGPYPLAAGDNTGAVPQVNWDNQYTGAYQNQSWWTSPFLHDNTAAATTLKITVGNPNHTQLQDDGPSVGNNSGGIQTLFYGCIRCNTDGGPCYVSSSGMPYSSYDLYVYTSSDPSALTAGGGTKSGSLSWSGISSGYVENGNYIKYSGCSGDFAFTDGGTIYGMQIVEAGGPPVWPDYLPGDFNKDGEVGPEDFGILKDNFGLDGLASGNHESWTLGDANDDGEIGPEDFGLLKDNFGLDGGPTGDINVYPLTNAPEPTTLALLALAGLAIRRKQR
ncbi:MAG: PEP-CTERM sorting domain-containing protein [Planctomycetota bacterium]|nr:PEP-CTERM sorting domain-containing protein [Planctomycetota bacterium]